MNIVLTDCEATHKYTDRAVILSLAYLEIDEDLNIVDKGIEYFWKPHYIIHPDATEIHGLTEDILLPFAPEYYQNVAKMFLKFQRAVVLAHNYNYDGAMLRRLFTEAEYGYNPVGEYCTMKGLKFEVSAKKSNGALKNPTLTEAHEHFGISEDDITLMTNDIFTGHNLLGVTGHHSAAWDTVAIYLMLAYGGREIMKKTGEWPL